MKFIGQHTDGSLYTMPDTAIHINKRPFFIPPYAEPCLCQYEVALRISRLGKNIGQRWAHRYYDAVTLVANMHTPSLPPSQGYGFDDAVSIGEWQPLDTLTPEQQERAASLIAEASRFFTLRQGDILLLEPHGKPFPVHIGDRIEMPPYLAFNIK